MDLRPECSPAVPKLRDLRRALAILRLTHLFSVLYEESVNCPFGASQCDFTPPEYIAFSDCGRLATFCLRDGRILSED